MEKYTDTPKGTGLASLPSHGVDLPSSSAKVSLLEPAPAAGCSLGPNPAVEWRRWSNGIGWLYWRV
ncbi:unnamed protein product [Clonostachys rosea]|uniref:Uncharacterized protein n=1 Tax=Bionectria ochroleuca TaxID=29856 RepID=A0ABY6TTC1_BIOOC|nr:unnamed protein product [Clonostachys rosea]